MRKDLPKFTGKMGAAELLNALGEDFAVVENPNYVYPPYELYPLAAKASALESGLLGAVMDMDGTTTTTETLCIHSLETMVRRIIGREGDSGWRGLDEERDYPHIIGNSTTKHVEYLIRTYRDEIRSEPLKFFTLHAAIWTLGKAADEGRKKEVRNNLATLGLESVLRDNRFVRLMKAGSLDTPKERSAIQDLADHYCVNLRLESIADIVRVAIDVYYQRYHEILSQIDRGVGGSSLAETLLGDPNRRLISPMSGIGYFLALIKGWLGKDAQVCYEGFVEYLREIGEPWEDLEANRAMLEPMGLHFERNPVLVAVVTSSIQYEANIVLSEVFRVLREQIEDWDVPKEKKSFLLERFASYRTVYDAVITASDSSEIRLKPHRDLYSLALHQLGVKPEDFGKVIGFEDSESGTIAIRAAGIPLCVAVPFPETKGHTFDAACHVAHGGIPEVVLKKLCFLPEALLAE